MRIKILTGSIQITLSHVFVWKGYLFNSKVKPCDSGNRHIRMNENVKQ